MLTGPFQPGNPDDCSVGTRELDKIFVSRKYAHLGLYVVAIHQGADKHCVLIDDRFPCDVLGKAIYCQGEGGAIWPMLIEKVLLEPELPPRQSCCNHPTVVLTVLGWHSTRFVPCDTRITITHAATLSTQAVAKVRGSYEALSLASTHGTVGHEVGPHSDSKRNGIAIFSQERLTAFNLGRIEYGVRCLSGGHCQLVRTAPATGMSKYSNYVHIW